VTTASAEASGLEEPGAGILHAGNCEGAVGQPAVLVRLRAYSHREVRVLSRITLQPVTDCNCVAARRGGEQQEVNDQSVG